MGSRGDLYLQEVEPGRSIPKVIHQTYRSKTLPPEMEKNAQRIRALNPDWEYRLYDDQNIEDYLRTHFPQLLTYFKRIEPNYGATKADFFRYLVMYKEGGVYLDIKSSVTRPFDEVIRLDDRFLLSHWNQKSMGRHSDVSLSRGEFQQWHIISAPGNPFLKRVIEAVCAKMDAYNPYRNGVGFHGVLRLAGPVTYTNTIAPLLDSYVYRLVDVEKDLGLIYSIFGPEYINHRHYSKQKNSILKFSRVEWFRMWLKEQILQHKNRKKFEGIKMRNLLKSILKKEVARRWGLSQKDVELLSKRRAVVSPQIGKKRVIELVQKLAPVTVEGKGLIRLGADGDGGYLIPDDLKGIEACFSPGVGDVSEFDVDCLARNMKVFLADNSIEGPAHTAEGMSFSKKHTGVLTSEDYMTLDDWVSFSLPESSSDLMLQMDIEGAEYEVLLGVSDSLMKRFRIITVEFHQMEQLWSRPFFQIASRAFDKLLQTHSCVHIHPNNFQRAVRRKGIEMHSVMEFTFLRKDRIASSSLAREFPHPLDRDCAAARPRAPLPAFWYAE